MDTWTDTKNEDRSRFSKMSSLAADPADAEKPADGDAEKPADGDAEKPASSPAGSDDSDSDSDDSVGSVDSDDADPATLAIDDEEVALSDAAFLAARISRAEALKGDANALFVTKDTVNAKLKYKEALLNLDRLKMKHLADVSAQLQADTLRANLNSNLAAAHNRLAEYEDAVSACEAVLCVDPCSSKALFRRAFAQFHRSASGAFDKEARADVMRCIKQDPKNKSARKMLAKIKTRMAEKKKERLAAASGMFNTGLYDDIEEKKKAAAKKKRAEEEAKRKEEERLWKEECVRREASGSGEAIDFPAFQAMLKEQREEEARIAKENRKREREALRKRQLERDSKPVVVGVDEDDESGILRGYKKTKDGRTTSYFTREIDDEKTRSLLAAAQAPKRLSASSAAAGVAVAGGGVAAPSLSTWNANGTTWESRDYTKVAKEVLARVFSSPDCCVSTGGVEESHGAVSAATAAAAAAAAAGGGGRGRGRGGEDGDPTSKDDVTAMLGNLAAMLSKVEISVLDVVDIDGSATRVQKSSGIAHMFDWNFKVNWKATLDPNGGLGSSVSDLISATGWMKVKECSDHSADFETSWGYNHDSKPEDLHASRAIVR